MRHRKASEGQTDGGGSLGRGGRGWEDRPGLTSRERIRYRTMRPRSTARVWLSKSGELMPRGGQLVLENSPLLSAFHAGSQGEIH